MFDDPMDLSDSGQARRERILRLLLAEARGRRRRRRVIRASGALAIILLVISVIALSRETEQPAAAPLAIDRPAPPPAVPTPAEPQRVTYIQTDPTIVERLSIRPGPRTWRIIGDDELLDALAAAGQPAGIVYHDGKATLLPR